MPLRLEPQRRLVYEKNPLKLVICQIRFPVLTRFEQAGFITPFEQALQTAFPRVAQEQQVVVAFGPGAPSAPVTSPSWRFQKLDGTASALLARDALTIETTAYVRFEEFEPTVRSAFAALRDLGVGVRERLGLRYVNEIHHPEAATPSAWRHLLNPEILGMVGGELLGDDVIHALQNIRVRDEDAVVVINHGFLGREAAANGHPFYQLDIDFGDERATPFDVEGSLNQVVSFHDRIKSLFEMSLSDPMRDHLVVVEELHA